MKPPPTPKLMPVSASKLLLDHYNKLFGIVYIALVEVIYTIILASGPQSWVRKSMRQSYDGLCPSKVGSLTCHLR
ncbi:hypothetical protein DSO57_1019277 [Entomophthora muscae]|uniref:Uncharacterized protein n=1 Tax=Entomophthora muscae TaxID=34485 RepID=A0ACC2RIR5_9FUNG|nr:hypothetical protein DSO57_1019277 [Entomophthora muscae]